MSDLERELSRRIEAKDRKIAELEAVVATLERQLGAMAAAPSSPSPTGGEAPDARDLDDLLASATAIKAATAVLQRDRIPVNRMAWAIDVLGAVSRALHAAPAPTGGREAREWTLVGQSTAPTVYAVEGPTLSGGERPRVREVLSASDAPRGDEADA